MNRLHLRAVIVGCLMFASFLGVSESIQAGTDQSSTSATVQDTYYYQLEYDTGRFPNILDVGDSVALLSWIRIGRGGKTVAGSLVSTKETIDSVQTRLHGDRLRTVKHEYVIPRPTQWWSLHLDGTARDQPFNGHHFPRAFPQLQAALKPEEKKPNWPYLSGVFEGCGRTLGPFFHVNLNCDHENSMGYVFFQKTSDETVVIGDLVTADDQLGPVIRQLYDRNMNMLSLAYNQFSEHDRRYFVHFAGKGELHQLGFAINRLEEMTKRSSN